MTLRYVRSGAGGAATGADWANAYLTLAAALTASAAGDTIYVSEDHAESSASAQTFTSPGTAASPVLVACVNHSGSAPPVSADLRATAAVTTTSSNSQTFAGDFIQYDGIIFTCGSSGNATLSLGTTANKATKFKNCALRLGTGSSLARIAIGNTSSAGSSIELENTTCQFGNAGQSVVVIGELIWKNTPTAITGATLPTSLFTFNSNRGVRIDLRGLDLSALGSGKTIFGVNGTDVTALQLTMFDCKIDPAVTLCGALNGRGSGSLDYARIDSGGTNYKHGRINFAGTESEETTIIRTGGASDGTTGFSEKIVTAANCNQYMPYDGIPFTFWNDTVGSAVTVTVEGIWGGGAVPNNDDIWLEVEYLGSSGSPLASFASSGKSDSLASNAALSSSSESWGGSTTAFKTSVTFTPQQKGPVILRIKAGKPSTTFYIDPKPTISGVTFSKTQAILPGMIANDLQSGGGGHIATRQQLGM